MVEEQTQFPALISPSVTSVRCFLPKHALLALEAVSPKPGLRGSEINPRELRPRST